MTDFSKLRTMTPEEVAAIPPEKPDPDYIRRNTEWSNDAPPREPTEAMLNAARDWSVAKYGRGVGNDGAIGCWQAMLDAWLVTSREQL